MAHLLGAPSTLARSPPPASSVFSKQQKGLFSFLLYFMNSACSTFPSPSLLLLQNLQALLLRRSHRGPFGSAQIFPLPVFLVLWDKNSNTQGILLQRHAARWRKRNLWGTWSHSVSWLAGSFLTLALAQNLPLNRLVWGQRPFAVRHKTAVW